MERIRNYAAECYLATAIQGKHMKDWEAVEKDSNGLVSLLTYISLFINDQIYGYYAEMSEVLNKSKLNRHMVKKLFRDMGREIKSYNKTVNYALGDAIEFFTDSMITMEEDMKPSIERYRWQINQFLTDKGVEAERNEIASYASTINMLAQAVGVVIDTFEAIMRKRYGIARNPLNYIRMDRIEKISGELANVTADNKNVINLNDEEKIRVAFEAFYNRLLRGDALKKVFDK